MQATWRKAFLGFAVAALAAMATGVSAQEAVGLGTWKLNVAKSKYSPGPAPKSGTIKFEAVGKGVKVTSQGVDAEGKATGTEFTADYDGKDVPFKGSAAIDTVSIRRIDAFTTERTDKKAGKVVGSIKRVVAKDGKSFTATTKATNAKGEPVNNLTVWDKQ